MPGYTLQGPFNNDAPPALNATRMTNIDQGVNDANTAVDQLPIKKVKAATTSAISFVGEQTIDGASLVTGDKALVKDQPTGSQNGIYLVSNGGWTRATDADSEAEISGGTTIAVQRGTVNGGKTFRCTNTGAVTVGTTALTFEQVITPTQGNDFFVQSTNLVNKSDRTKGAALVGYKRSLTNVLGVSALDIFDGDAINVKAELGLGGFERVMTLRAQMNAGSNVVQVNEDVSGLTTNHYIDVYGGGALQSGVGQPWDGIAGPHVAKITAVDTVNKNITLASPVVTTVPVASRAVKVDHVSLQALFDDLNTAGGGTVFFPRGTYMGAFSTRMYENITIIGEPGATMKIVPAAREYKGGYPAFRSLLDGNYVTTDLHIYGMTFDGNSSTFTPWSGQGAPEESLSLLELSDCTDVEIRGCTFKNPIGDCILLASFGGTGLRRADVIGNKFLGDNFNRQAVSVTGGEDINIENNYMYRMANSSMPGSIDIEPEEPWAVAKRITIQNNTIIEDGGVSGAICVAAGENEAIVRDLQDVQILGNTLVDCPRGVGVHAFRKYCSNVYVDYNTFRNSDLVFELQDDAVVHIGPNNRIIGAQDNLQVFYSEYRPTTFARTATQAINREPGSGRFAGIVPPQGVILPTTAGFKAPPDLDGYGTTGISGGKFIYNNTTFGGSAGALSQDVIDLMRATGRYTSFLDMTDVKNYPARFGPEFYIGQWTAAVTGTTTTPSDGFIRYLAFVGYGEPRVNSSHGAITYAFWARLKTVAGSNAGSFVINRRASNKHTLVQVDGTDVGGDYAFITYDNTSFHKGWHHIVVKQEHDWGGTNIPEIYAQNGDVIQIALLCVFDGEPNIGRHQYPIQAATDQELHSYKAPPKIINTTPYTALWNEYALLVDATGGARTINLPTSVGLQGKEYRIVKTDASANTVTIDPSGAQTWQGAATKVLSTQWAEARGISDGANWI